MQEVPENMLNVLYKNMQAEIDQVEYEKNYITPNITMTDFSGESVLFPFKYSEDKIVDDLYDYLKSTYGEHYATEEDSVQCFDAWIAMGDATPTFRNTAIKYLWRYGKKNGNNKKDLMKALHYIVLCLHNDHYRGK